jgi:hypothetical protein
VPRVFANRALEPTPVVLLTWLRTPAFAPTIVTLENVAEIGVNELLPMSVF